MAKAGSLPQSGHGIIPCEIAQLKPKFLPFGGQTNGELRYAARVLTRFP